MPEAVRITLCPPLRELLVTQWRAKLRRAWKRLRTPTRAIPAALVAVSLIAVVVLLQTEIFISLDESQSLAVMESISPLVMLTFLLVVLFLSVCIKPHRRDFLPEETHRLIGGPFRRDQVLLYSVTSWAIVDLFNSVVVALFVPHVSFFVALSGCFLAVLFTDLVSTTVEMAVVHATEKTSKNLPYLLCAVIALLGLHLYRASIQSEGHLEFHRAFVAQALLLSETPVVRVLTSPFAVFTKIIVAKDFFSWAAWMALGLVMVYAAAQTLLRVDRALANRAWRREQKAFARVEPSRWVRTDARRSLRRRLKRMSRPIPWLAGTGPIIWRQLKAVRHVRTGLGRLILPLGLITSAMAGYITYRLEQDIFLIVLVTSALLPALFPFDFRGDLKGLSALRMMPLRPRSVVLGQLAVPVMLLSCFQLAALLLPMVHDPQLLGKILLTMLLLIPINTINLALDNLNFLLFPYRNVDLLHSVALVRLVVMVVIKFCMILPFYLLACLVVDALCWAAQIPWVAEWLVPIHELLFCALLIGLCVAATGFVAATCWVYQRCDWSEDVPMSRRQRIGLVAIVGLAIAGGVFFIHQTSPNPHPVVVAIDRGTILEVEQALAELEDINQLIEVKPVWAGSYGNLAAGEVPDSARF